MEAIWPGGGRGGHVQCRRRLTTAKPSRGGAAGPREVSGGTDFTLFSFHVEGQDVVGMA